MIPGRGQTKTARPRSQAAESLSCENAGCLGSRSLGEVIAKATEDSWPLPPHDSASPVPRVTSPLPWPCGWWPWGWMCLPGDLELHGWVGGWTVEVNSRLTLFESFWHWTGFYGVNTCAPTPLTHASASSPPKHGEASDKTAGSNFQKQAWHSQANHVILILGINYLTKQWPQTSSLWNHMRQSKASS